MPEVEVEVNGLGSRQGSLRPVSTADFSWVSPVYCLQVVSEAVEYTVKVLESLTSGLPHIMSSCCPGSWSCPLVQMHGVIVITDFLSREIEDPHTRAEQSIVTATCTWSGQGVPVLRPTQQGRGMWMMTEREAIDEDTTKVL